MERKVKGVFTPLWFVIFLFVVSVGLFAADECTVTLSDASVQTAQFTLTPDVGVNIGYTFIYTDTNANFELITASVSSGPLPLGSLCPSFAADKEAGVYTPIWGPDQPVGWTATHMILIIHDGGVGISSPETWDLNVSTGAFPATIRFKVVSSNDGSTASGTSDFTVCPGVPVDNPPVATINLPAADEVTISEGANLVFQGIGTDDGAITAMNWDFGGGGTPPTAAGGGPHTIAFNSAGDYTVTFTVEDDATPTPQSGSDTVLVHVLGNNPPVASFTVSSDTVSVGEVVSFTNTSTDPDGDPLSYEWDFGDTESSTDTNPTHAYDAPGEYDVVLTATDDHLLSDDSDPTTITVVRPPTDVVFVLDASGSMRDSNKYDRMVEAAQLFYDIFKNIGTGDIDDKWGAVFFQWLRSTGADNTVADPVSLQLTSLPVTDIRPGLLSHKPPQVYGYRTPIGEGLLEGISLLGDLSQERRKILLLLSDGKENEGTPIESISIPTSAGLANNVTVYTVGLGEDTEIEPEKIRDKAIDSGGDYRLTDDPLILEDFFVEILGSALMKAERAEVSESVGGASATVDIATSTDAAAFILTWSNPAEPIAFDLVHSDGATAITPASASAPPPGLDVYYSSPQVGDTHAFYIIKDAGTPLSSAGAQTWTMWNLRHAVTSAPVIQESQKIVLEDLQLHTKFYFDKTVHYVGEPIILTAEIRDKGEPVLNADVFVEIDGAAEGIGNFLTMGIHNYGLANLIPRYPIVVNPAAFKKDTVKGKKIKDSKAAITAPGIMTLQNQLTAVSDYLDTSSRTLIARQLLAFRGATSLERFSNRIRLYDNGTHGDPVPNDGKYYYVFRNTYAEGNYNFKFTAKGVAPLSGKFGRTKTISEVVRVKVDTGISLPAVTILDTYDLPRYMALAQIDIRPQDKFGNLIGPFRRSGISFQTTQGRFRGNVVDNFDGTYSTVLEFDKREEKPRITTSALGQTLTPVEIVTPVKRKPFQVFIKAGVFVFADKLDIDTTFAYELGFGYPFSERFSLIGELGYFTSKDSYDISGNIFNVNVNIAYYLFERDRKYLPYLTLGIGLIDFREFTQYGTEGAVNFGGGLQVSLTDKISLQFEARYFLISNPGGRGISHNLLATSGICYSFK